MGISSLLDAPLFSGSTSSSETPSKYPVALAGRPFLVDLTHDVKGVRSGFFHHESIPLLRQQADGANEPGEASLNPEAYWRRSQSSWHHGAGQTFLDRSDSDTQRFRSSKGIDVWTRWQMSLLPSTSSKRASASTNFSLVPVGSYLYLIDGPNLLRTADITVVSPAWVTMTGTPVGNINAVASDGYTIYTAHGANGVYTTTRGGTASTSYNTLPCTQLAYVKGRLMAVNGAAIYNITSGTAPAALYTHPNTDFTWVGFAEGASQIYAAGYSGDKSIIYRTSIKQDGTALDIPIVASELPDGEIVRSIQGYLGYLVIGSDLGVRFAAVDTNGNLTIGSLILTTSAVRCFEPQDKYVWYGLSNYDASSTGLGRLDLTTFTSPLTPAYASDLMATTQGVVLTAVTFQNRRVFAVSGIGIYAQDSTKVLSGTLDTGLWTFGLPDRKIAMAFDVSHRALNGTISSSLSADETTFVSLGTESTQGNVNDPEFVVGEKAGEVFEVRQTLTRSTIDTTLGPVITRHTLKTNPPANIGKMITAPLVITEQLRLGDDTVTIDPAETLLFLETLHNTRNVVTWQEGTRLYSVTVEEIQWLPSHLVENGTAFNGLAIMTMKSLQ